MKTAIPFARFNKLRLGIVASTLATVMGTAGPATQVLAQDGETLSEIVVTAQFRETRLQDTPLAITAVNSDLMEARSQTSIYEVAAQAPNVTLAPQGQANGSGLIAFIRGVGQTDFNFALEPGVGVYVDDVYYPTLTGSLLDLMDLDRVEILRGPQGTLAGRNSIGGAIKLFSSKPSGEGTGSFQASYGSYNRVEARGFADFTLIDDVLFARVAGVSKNRDGYVDRLDYAQTHPGEDIPSFNLGLGNGEKLGTLGGTSYAAARLSLRWIASPDVEVNVAGDFTNDSSQAGADVLIRANHAATTPEGSPWLADSNGNAIPYDCRFVPAGPFSCDTSPEGYNPQYINYATFLDGVPATSQSPFKPFAVDPVQQLDTYGIQSTVDWSISPDFELKSISSWREYDSSWAQDADGSPIASQQLLQTLKHHQWSQEIRLNGALFDDRLDFTVGGFWFEQGGTLEARVDLNYAGIDFIHGPDTTPSTSKAAFAQTTFHLNDSTNLSGGVRYSRDKKVYTYFRSNPDGSIPSAPCAFFLGAPTAGPTGIGNEPNCLLLGLYNVTDSFKGDRTDWRVALDHRFSDTFMSYTQVSTGFRSGGVNPRPFFGPSAGAANQLKSFDPETLTSYEVGFKSDLFDRSLRVNAALFYNDYKNIILTLNACPTAPCLQPNNVGKAKVKGAELEVTYSPIEHLSFDGAVSYLDFDYKKFTVDPAVLPAALSLSMVTPFTPEWKWSTGVQYEAPLSNGGTLTARVDGNYQSHIYTDPINNDVFNRIDSYFLANARLTWKAPDEAWTIALEVQNLTDKYYFLSLFSQPDSSSTVSGQPGLPRTWAITMKRDF
ncbi:MAG: TonB-dependent receptor [Pseudomonadales bacterium]|nr:TonB-dependent receptor [Pseudomonadales bacterium]